MRQTPRPAGGNYGAPPPHNGGAEPGGLESELKRALDRAARREHDTKAAAGTPPGWEPIFMAQEVSGNALPPATRPKPAPAGAKRTSSGGRNILAISLSAAVVGLAFQQIGAQWNQSRTGGGVSAVPEATTSEASVLYSGGQTYDALSGYGVQPSAAEPEPLPPLRPSLADDAPPQPAAGGTKEREAFLKEIDQAASVLAAQPKRAEASRTTPVSAPLRDAAAEPSAANAISGADEQAMLRRARELMERGHITGARLIFEHLALQQSALGAFALAQTYDEKYLKTQAVAGMEGDPKLAAKWYRRAAELGSQFAARN